MELLGQSGVQRLGLELPQQCWRATQRLERARLLVQRFCSLRHLKGWSYAMNIGEYAWRDVEGVAADILAVSAIIF